MRTCGPYRFCVTLILVTCSSLPTGCRSGSPRPLPPSASAMSSCAALEPNEPAPFGGWLVPPGYFNYLLRCQDHVEAEGTKVD